MDHVQGPAGSPANAVAANRLVAKTAERRRRNFISMRVWKAPANTVVRPEARVFPPTEARLMNGGGRGTKRPHSSPHVSPILQGPLLRRGRQLRAVPAAVSG